MNLVELTTILSLYYTPWPVIVEQRDRPKPSHNCPILGRARIRDLKGVEVTIKRIKLYCALFKLLGFQVLIKGSTGSTESCFRQGQSKILSNGTKELLGPYFAWFFWDTPRQEQLVDNLFKKKGLRCSGVTTKYVGSWDVFAAERYFAIGKGAGVTDLEPTANLGVFSDVDITRLLIW